MRGKTALRILTAAVIAFGFVLVFLVISQDGSAKFSALRQPSYYAIRNLTLAFVGGSVTVICALVSCFLSWFHDLDAVEGEIPNAVGEDMDEIDTVLRTSTLGDSGKENQSAPQVGEDEEDAHE